MLLILSCRTLVFYPDLRLLAFGFCFLLSEYKVWNPYDENKHKPHDQYGANGLPWTAPFCCQTYKINFSWPKDLHMSEDVV